MWQGIVLSALLAGAAAAQTPGDGRLPVKPGAGPAQVTRRVQSPGDFTAAEPFEAQSGGAATVQAGAGDAVFSQPSATLAPDHALAFKLGRALFRKTWVAAPASTLSADGLGPLFNARACQDCHRNDGRGRAPDGPDDNGASLVLQLSIPGGNAPQGIAGYHATLPDPVYGGQLQDSATPGLTAEGRTRIVYREVPATLGDGTVVLLRVPDYAVSDPAHGQPGPNLMLSPRVAPPMIGLGLLEAIPAADILAREDPDDADGDGISGRAQIVVDPGLEGPMPGRFGHKAGAATIRAQVAKAFSVDMGLSTALHPDPSGDCTPAQVACRAAPHGAQAIHGGHEVPPETLDLLTLYSRNLGVPERRNAGAPAVLRGKALFHNLNCTGCHVPSHVTHRLKDQPEQGFHLIWPYTDLLLHDMGGGLADHRPEGRADGREWRTAPLWGIGLTAQVSGQAQFLHDGRARSLLEAILWHGGEAQAARDGLVALPAKDRDALIAYLESL